MSITWNDNAPIYRQLRDRVVAMILDGVLKQGDALPSVRQVAADFQINPITVSKAYQELVDENLVEKRRGLGMYVTDGARGALMKSERDMSRVTLDGHSILKSRWHGLFKELLFPAEAQKRGLNVNREEFPARACHACSRPDRR